MECHLVQQAVVQRGGGVKRDLDVAETFDDADHHQDNNWYSEHQLVEGKVGVQRNISSLWRRHIRCLKKPESRCVKQSSHCKTSTVGRCLAVDVQWLCVCVCVSPHVPAAANNWASCNSTLCLWLTQWRREGGRGSHKTLQKTWKTDFYFKKGQDFTLKGTGSVSVLPPPALQYCPNVVNVLRITEFFLLSSSSVSWSAASQRTNTIIVMSLIMSLTVSSCFRVFMKYNKSLSVIGYQNLCNCLLFSRLSVWSFCDDLQSRIRVRVRVCSSGWMTDHSWTSA